MWNNDLKPHAVVQADPSERLLELLMAYDCSF